MRFHPRRRAETSVEAKPAARGLNIGAIGMGVGTIGVYAQPDDRLVFYEIDPEVEVLAREYFSFLADAEQRADVRVILGDGRVSLENSLAESGPERFDILVLDAFSGDAIPLHLLTDEAFSLCWQHLRPDGILAIHVINLHLDLADGVRNLAARQGKQAAPVMTSEAPRIGGRASLWILVTGNAKFLRSADAREHLRGWQNARPRPILWTDDYSNLLQVLK